MTPRAFDAIACRAATTLHRRGLLGLISHGALAVALPPLRTLAGSDHHDDHGGGGGNNGGGGGGDKDKKTKRCRKQSHACALTVGGYCDLQYPFEQENRTECRRQYFFCCGFYRKCEPTKAERCIRDSPY